MAIVDKPKRVLLRAVMPCADVEDILWKISLFDEAG